MSESDTANKEPSAMNEEQLAQHMKKILDEKDQSLDVETAQALQEIRQQALGRRSARQAPAWRSTPGWQLAAGAVASIALLVLVLPQSNETPSLVPLPYSDAQLLGSEMDLELLEDLDFYLWLEEIEGIEAIDGLEGIEQIDEPASTG